MRNGFDDYEVFVLVNSGMFINCMWWKDVLVDVIYFYVSW